MSTDLRHMTRYLRRLLTGRTREEGRRRLAPESGDPPPGPPCSFWHSPGGLRGGWIELARHDLPLVAAPTLLIVGGADPEIVEMSRRALELLSCPQELVVIPGAIHFFPEAGALEEVAHRTTHWFCRQLRMERPPTGPSGLRRR